jgi:hypothetical protein
VGAFDLKVCNKLQQEQKQLVFFSSKYKPETYKSQRVFKDQNPCTRMRALHLKKQTKKAFRKQSLKLKSKTGKHSVVTGSNSPAPRGHRGMVKGGRGRGRG